MINSLVYKDNLPSDSIEKFRTFLLKYFKLSEMNYISEIDGIYSYRLEIEGTGIGTNGKGTSPTYARASAYGEFIERLSNMMLIKGTGSDVPKFRYDVVKLSVNSFLSSQLLLNYKNNKEYFFKLNSVKNNAADFCYAIPYKNITLGNIENVPSFFLSFYGSNGMAAGNSFHEMSVQALSEILERYALKRIIEYNDKVYIFSNEFVSEMFPEIGRLIEQIESMGYAVKIYDCSLGKQLPCYAVAFFADDGSFSVSFGAHPQPEVAISRCFTEINQGSEKILFKSNKKKVTSSNYYNLRRIFHNGFGVYPITFLDEKNPSPNLHLLKNFYVSNLEMYDFCINKIQDLGFQVLYHDASYLGFSSGHYIVPGMSDIFIPNEEHLRFLDCKKKFFPKFNDFLNMSFEEQTLLLELYDYFFNTYQYETNVKYLSSYSDDSNVNLVIFMILGFALVGKSLKSRKYFDFLLEKSEIAVEDKSIHEIKSVINDGNIDKIKQIILDGNFKRKNINQNLVDVYFPILYNLQEEYYK